MTETDALLRRLISAERDCLTQGLTAAAILLQDARLCIIRAQPEYLSGCRDPDSCHRHGECMYLGCPHYGKTECRPRMTVLAQVDGILYPAKETK